MKRTLFPKFLAVAICAYSWTQLPIFQAMLFNLAVLSFTLIVLTIPVLLPRSNFYVPTVGSGPLMSKGVALTFDDGPDPRWTPRVLDFLDREGIQAAFFVVGSRALQYPDLLREIVARGHVIGNHSYDHGLSYHFRGWKHFRCDIDAFDRAITQVTGLKCRFFRSPQGFRTPILADVLKERELICIGWQARGYDAFGRKSDSILKSVLTQLKRGSIILLHDGAGLGGSEGREATLEALPNLVREARQRGLSFQRLDALLAVNAYSEMPCDSLTLSCRDMRLPVSGCWTAVDRHRLMSVKALELNGSLDPRVETEGSKGL